MSHSQVIYEIRRNINEKYGSLQNFISKADLNITRSTLSGKLQPHSNPSLKFLNQLAAFLDLEITVKRKTVK